MPLPIPNRLTDVVCAVVLLATGFACQLNDGHLTLLSLLVMTTVEGACLLAFFPRIPPPAGSPAVFRRLLFAMLLFQMGLCVACYPGARWGKGKEALEPLALAWNAVGWTFTPADWLRTIANLVHMEWLSAQPTMIAGFAGLSLLGLLTIRYPNSRLVFLGLLSGYLAAGAFWLHKTHPPGIDTFLVQQVAARSLLDGQNPYSATFPDIYEGGKGTFPPEFVKDGMVTSGVPYPPLSLFCAVPGYIALGDHRYSQLGALLLAAWLIGTCRPGPVPKLAALLLLFWPRTMMVLEFAFTEPFVVLALAATVSASIHAPRWTPIAFGLLLFSKPSTVFMLPLGLLLIPRWTFRAILEFGAIALVTGVIVTAPLVLVNPADAFRATIQMHLRSLFRDDSLSYLALMSLSGLSTALALRIAAIAFPLALASVGASLARFERNASAFALGIVVTYIPFLLFNKQAFLNYYFLVIAAAACSIAARVRLPDDVEPAGADRPIATT